MNERRSQNQATRLAEEARKVALKLRMPEVFHVQVSREWEEYATVERTRGPSHEALYTADLLDALLALVQPAVSEETERVAFEAKFPKPFGIDWIGDGYEVKDSYARSYTCDRYVAKWVAWLARAQSSIGEN